MTETKQPIIISFDGNIGSGKSSVMKYFEQYFEKYCNLKTYHYKVCFLQEPVSVWENIIDKNDGKNVIEKFYENNEKYGFAFQMMAYISRLSLLKEALNKNYDIIFTERSVFTDRNVFAKMLYDSKKINEIEYQIYNKWFDEFSNTIKKNKTVYIRTTPHTSERRIKKRARTGEDIPLEYIQNCHYYHDIWLYSSGLIESGNVLIIDGNEETNTSQFIQNNYFDNIMEKVFNFMKN
jgi:deoxyadenosine/deoxycytidine kinase